MPGREPLTRKLPPAPAFLQSVPLPKVNPGDSAYVVVKQRGQIIRRQNVIITSARKWYEGVKQTYSESPVPKNRFFGF